MRRTRVAPPHLPQPGLVAKIVTALVLVAVVAGAYAFWPREDRVRVTGEFQRAVGLFPGSDVRVLGVQVGEVTEVTPKEATRSWSSSSSTGSTPCRRTPRQRSWRPPGERPLRPVIPAYQGGPKMGDGARIGLDRTAVRSRLDRISRASTTCSRRARPSGRQRGGRSRGCSRPGPTTSRARARRSTTATATSPAPSRPSPVAATTCSAP